MSSLYRLSSGDYRTELFLMGDESFKDPQAARFIFESPFFLAGNIKPEGLFRFFEMDSLLSRDALKKRSGYATDSSAENLKNPGAVLILFDRLGCVFESGSNESRKFGIWLNTEPYGYTSFDLAMDYYQVKTAGDTEDGEWFPSTAPLPGGDHWHGGGDIRHEAALFSARIRGACSGGRHFLPGTTIMPDLTLFLNSVVIQLRYWRNSEYYRNVSAEFAEWNWQWEGLIRYYGSNAYWEALYRGGQPRAVLGFEYGISSEYSVRCKREGIRWDWDLKGSFESEPFSEESSLLNPEASCSYRYYPWTVSLVASALWEGIPYEQSSHDMSLNLKHCLSRNITNSLKIAYSRDRKTAAIDPSWETLFRGKTWSIKGKGVYFYSLDGKQVDPPYSLSVMVEWSR
ncbi:MAG: hypothetical protein B6241_07325 [Spirochaetaceae bacterium 4572_59]|nr:MAG: hypothetical protein B6241_07325 [Spirochaetaceae bacterium 4572_59]